MSVLGLLELGGALAQAQAFWDCNGKLPPSAIGKLHLEIQAYGRRFYTNAQGPVACLTLSWALSLEDQ